MERASKPGMRILILSQHFWPENFRINQIAEKLAKKNIDVSVLTGKPNYPDGNVFDGYRSTVVDAEVWEGVRILRVPIIPRGSGTRLRLALNYLSFIASAVLTGVPRLLRKDFDAILIYATSPLLQAIPALFLKLLKKTPIILYVQDLWPESLEATGHIRNRCILQFVRWIVGIIYKHVDTILISSEPFRHSIAEYGKTAKIYYLPNSVDDSFTQSQDNSSPPIKELQSGFNLIFAGNVGSAQAIDVIVDAAIKLREQDEIKFLIIGSGSELLRLKEKAKKFELNNLVLLGRFPMNAMPGILAHASALLITLADRPIFSQTVPNKLQAYLAVGRPIIACMNGEGARIVREARAGVCVPAEDGAALANAVKRVFMMSNAERDLLGRRGKKYFKENYDEGMLLQELICHLQKIQKDKV